MKNPEKTLQVYDCLNTTNNRVCPNSQVHKKCSLSTGSLNPADKLHQIIMNTNNLKNDSHASSGTINPKHWLKTFSIQSELSEAQSLISSPKPIRESTSTQEPIMISQKLLKFAQNQPLQIFIALTLPCLQTAAILNRLNTQNHKLKG